MQIMSALPAGDVKVLKDTWSDHERLIVKERYVVWKKAQTIARNREEALELYCAFLGLRVESSAST